MLAKIFRLNLLLLGTAMPVLASETSFSEIHQCYSKADQPGSAILLARGDHVIYKNAIGLADLDSKLALSDQDVFQIGSVTKQFTAAAIMLLEQQGKLSSADKLAQYFPQYPQLNSNITLAQVLSHSAGLADYLDNPATMKLTQDYAALDAVVAELMKDKAIAAPGEKYSYSNTGYVLLGKIIEQVSERSYASFMQASIFQPLGLKNTQVISQKSPEQGVKGYTRKTQEQKQQKQQQQATQYILPDRVDRSWIHAAGGITSTLNDMVLWQQALKDGKLLQSKNYARMTTPYQLNSGEKIKYGFGFDIYPISGKASISHQGRVPGYASWAVYFPDEHVYGITLSNNDSVHPGPALLHLLGIALKVLPPTIDVPISPIYTKQFVGQYQLENGDIRTISLLDGQLMAQYNQGEKHRLQVRKDNAVSYACNSDYFQLVNQDGKPGLQEVSLYFGPGPIAYKIQSE